MFLWSLVSWWSVWRLDRQPKRPESAMGTGDQAMGGRPGSGQFMSGDSQLTINGGYVLVDAWGDKPRRK